MFDPVDARPQPPHWLHRLQVLQADAAQVWTQRVHDLRRHWTRRNSDAPFFTLGIAAYLDGVDRDPALNNESVYRSKVLRRHNNQLLQRHFGDLLEHCRVAIEQWRQQAVRFDPEHTALPGFHIHLPHPVFGDRVASCHNDLQFRQAFPTEQFSDADVMTFTLALSLPKGAGLSLWVDEQEQFHPYHLGEMVLHSGLVTHQAILHPHGEPVARIALQGHAVRRDHTWTLYW